MLKSTLHFWVISIVCLAGCAPDNSLKLHTSNSKAGNSYNTTGQGLHSGSKSILSAVEVGNHTGSSLLDNIPAVESVDVWENKYGPGLRLTTTHYEIFTTLLEPVILRRIPRFMESIYRAYKTQLTEVIEEQNGFKIYLFAERRQWEEFTKDFAGDQARTFCKIKSGAYYHNNACVAYDIGPARTLSVLGHEGWHQFSDKHFKFRLPSWVDEGVAMLFETNDAASGKFKLAPAENAYRLNSLRKTLENDKMMPLKELIASNPGDVLAMDRTEAVMAFYSQSYALIRFLQEADSSRRLAAYHLLLTDGLRGRWQLDSPSRRIATDRNIPRNILWNQIVGLVLFEDYVSDDYEQIEKEYLAFCRQIVK